MTRSLKNALAEATAATLFAAFAVLVIVGSALSLGLAIGLVGAVLGTPMGQFGALGRLATIVAMALGGLFGLVFFTELVGA